MAEKLFVTFDYTISTDTYEIVETNMNNNGIATLLETYIRSVVGAGADEREPEKRDVYTLTMTLDVTYDDIEVHHNCGNLGLVAGILSTIFARFPDAE